MKIINTILTILGLLLALYFLDKSYVEKDIFGLIYSGIVGIMITISIYGERKSK